MTPEQLNNSACILQDDSGYFFLTLAEFPAGTKPRGGWPAAIVRCVRGQITLQGSQLLHRFNGEEQPYTATKLVELQSAPPPGLWVRSLEQPSA